MTRIVEKSTHWPGLAGSRSAPVQLAALVGAVVVLAIATRSLVPGFILLALWALRTPQGAVQALSVTWFVVAINPGLLPNTTDALALRWLVVFAGLVSSMTVWIRLRTPRYPTVFWLLIFLGVASTSAATSSALFVSLGKLAVFGAGTLLLLLAAYFTVDLADFWYGWFSTILFSVVIVAVPLIFLDLGYTVLIVGNGFRGLLNYSQANGVFLAVAIPFFAGRFLSPRYQVWPPLAATFVALISLFLTRSRGAVLATGLGILAVVAIGFLRNRVDPHTLSASRTIAILVLLVPVLTIFWGTIQEPASDFILKRDNTTVVASIESRTALIGSSIEEFRANPILGIGFGLASADSVGNAANAQESGSLFSAPVEKGFLPAALLEWTGLLGTAVFLVFFGTLMIPIVRFARIEIVGAIVAAIATNAFEATLLSIGGMGLLLWLLLFWGFVDSMRPLAGASITANSPKDASG